MAHNITICAIPKPVSEDHVTRYTHLRLAALKTNPEAFGSTFAGESAFSREQWSQRVNNPARTTFFAACAPSAIGDASLERDALGSYHHESNWIGTLSLLGPEMLRNVPFPAKIAEVELDKDAEIYMLTGMWVDPEFRKKGVGRQLIEQAVKSIDGSQDRGKKDRRKRFLLLEVTGANFAAQRLYESQGFMVELGATKEGKKWMALNVS